MSDGYQVTMPDLLAAAGKFRDASQRFAGAMSATGPAPADGGNWVIDDALAQVLKSVGLLHTRLTGVIANDAANLTATYHEYRGAEEQNVAVAQGVVVAPQEGK